MKYLRKLKMLKKQKPGFQCFAVFELFLKKKKANASGCKSQEAIYLTKNLLWFLPLLSNIYSLAHPTIC